MKKIFLLASLYYLPFLLVAQNKNYLPFVSPNNEWIVEYDVFIKDPANEFQRFSFSTDSTLLNGKYYRNLIFSFKETGALNMKDRFMREENGKVYLYDEKLKKERLMYNMNYNVGDTIPPSGVFAQPSAIVTNVGTVIYADNLPRKFYTFAYNDEKCKSKVTIVEAMGDKAAFLFELYCGTADGGFPGLRCFSTDGKQLYKRANVNKCFQSLSSKEIAMDNFNIYPNPTNGEISMSYNLQNVNFCEWKLYDNLGVLKYSHRLNNAENVENINLESLNSGLYFWQLCNDNKIEKNGKVLIMR